MRDLVLLFVVAVVNLNVVPSIAANGGVTVWLWLLALVCFFWPQGIAVIELSRRYPGEGGVYLWTKKYFGDFHGFLSGWCYWTNNVFYVPTVLLYLVGVATFAAGPGAKKLAEDPQFTFFAALAALVILVLLNILGSGVGKWVNNLGGIGTGFVAVALIALGVATYWREGTMLRAADFSVVGADWHIVATFGTICFGLVGLELGSVMGDEIRDPEKTVPRAVVWGGIASGILYIGATLTLLLAVPKEEIGVLQGMVEAISSMAGKLGLSVVVAPLALVMSVSIAGIASAWLSGSARIPFVAGLDRYLPEPLGRLHPRAATPYVALMAHGIFSALFLAMSFMGQASVKDAFQLMLALAVVLQLVPFLYVYAALIRIAMRPDAKGCYQSRTLWFAGVSGIVTTAIGMVVAFVPPSGTRSVWLFEGKMALGTAFFVVLAVFFFFVYGGDRDRPIAT
ncbi:MAG: APC family permease [Acidobacteriales bacterium]|nr:APC family permease [Terriglobales bacterium]